jgi:membrane protease YdiL (CAAX protease family)
VNFLLLLEAAGVALAALWLAQTILLLLAGEPWRVGPLRHRSESPLVRWGMKFALQGALVGLLAGYPLATGQNPLDYHQARLHPVAWWVFAGVLVSAILGLCPMLALNVLVGWVRIVPHHSAAKSVRKVARSLITPVPLAFVEEAVFRGVLLDALLDTIGTAGAIVLSAGVFASVHFFRPQKRLLLPALGLFALGVLLGAAYVLGGRAYWLPVAIHAGGVVFIQVLRPFVEYKGPPWLVGYSSYPICGLLGVTSMTLYLVGVSRALGAGLLV